MRDKRGVYRVLWGAGRKETLGRHRRRRDDNITIDSQEVGWGATNWIALTQSRG
jgi:hypothetical protein